MKLLLFDIDGTLLRVTQPGAKILVDALESLVGRAIVTDGVRFSGRTDYPIIRDVLVNSGLSRAEAAEMLPEVMSTYSKYAHAMLAAGNVRILPGVRALLDRLQKDDAVVLGLLTGNIEELAYAKLKAGGLESYFSFGAFGSDREDRYLLPPIAVERANQHTGILFEGKDVVIIGDTEHDILCGSSIGVYAVGVATGHFDRDYLSGYSPDLLLDDLTDHNQFVETVVLA